MKDITERLRSPEVFITHGQMISPVGREGAAEIDRLRKALSKVASKDIQSWAEAALRENHAKAWQDALERIARHDMQKIAIDALGRSNPV
jgi:hypothetical protein